MLILFDQLEEIAASTVLKDDPEMIPGFIPVEEAEDMPVLQVVENSNFIQHFLAPILLHRFYSNVVDRLFFPTLRKTKRV